MVINYTQLNLINFPIFALPSNEIEVTDGLLRTDGLVIDDRNQIGETLGARRLQTPHKVLKLKKFYGDIPELLSAKDRVFVDNHGYCFIYERTKFCKVNFHRILKVSLKDLATILKVAGISFPMLVRRPPPLGKDWVGVLYLDNNPWIPYVYSEEKQDSFRRKI